MLTPNDLAANQVRAIKDALTVRHFGLTSDCGFGKTVVLYSIAAKCSAKFNRPALIVSDPTIVVNTWGTEHLKWSHLKDLRVSVFHSKLTPVQRKRLLAEECDVLTCSYQLLPWLLANKPPEFSAVLADEGSCLKGTKSTYRKNLTLLSKDALVRGVATATPKSREEDGYWGICKFIDGGEALGKNITDFRARYMYGIAIPGTRGKMYKMNKGAGDQVRAAIKHMFLEYPLEDAADVPFKEHVIKRNLSTKAADLYQEFAKKGILAGVDMKGGEPLTKLEVQNYLAQLSSGFVYEEVLERLTLADLEGSESAIQLIRKSRTRTPIDLFPDRMKLMMYVYNKVVDHFGKEPTLVWYQYTHEREQLLRLFPNAIDDQDKTFVDKFNTGKYSVGLVQYQRSSKGLNLQKVCRLMIQYSQTFNFENNYQSVRRIARQGQTRDVHIFKLHFNNTVDDLKLERQDNRQFTHDQFRKMILR